MITEFKIENYKSIEKLSINLGRLNVFIGENGCGKSNILEAITLTSAATQNKLDNEFLTSRGIRVTIPEFMRSAFDFENLSSSLKLGYTIDNKDKIDYELTNDNKPYSKWEYTKTPIIANTTQSLDEAENAFKIFQNNQVLKNLVQIKMTEEKSRFLKDLNGDEMKEAARLYTDAIYENRTRISDFLIYSPENSSLRTFAKPGQIEPLGIGGEGLFKLLKYFASHETENLNEIKSYLNLFDWFEDFTIREGLSEGESFLQIKDRYLDSKIIDFDQRSSNEGFLFVLFYFSLLISDKTPSFFAIDNIEASLNPKLCTKLVKYIAELAKKHNKQVILTTHNPAILDGLNLNDEEQKLFLIYRNKIGHTLAKQIDKPKPLVDEEPIRLSEAFLRGYLGGLPKNFTI